ncbi:MAG: YggS family pyridoxal phosphate-dependent enzyme [Ardenticatenales bacterium]|nr:YggS family pyridoxal phosphate-dependent enzyme [Ardenticatenales bacterium]
MLPEDFTDRLQIIHTRLAGAAARAGRRAEEITLVAVTKGHPAEMVRAAYEAGLRHFGENRPTELLQKQATLLLPDAYWHFIGHIQRRRARELVGKSHLVHSIDRLELAQELSKRAVAGGAVVAGLLQVNSSGEESKGGWDITLPEGSAHFLADIAPLLALPNLEVRGLMTMAPYYEEAERTRPTFSALRALRQTLREHFPAHSFEMLSMGMSNDFEVAIEEGATHVRIGTSLFGPPEI